MTMMIALTHAEGMNLTMIGTDRFHIVSGEVKLVDASV